MFWRVSDFFNQQTIRRLYFLSSKLFDLLALKCLESKEKTRVAYGALNLDIRWGGDLEIWDVSRKIHWTLGLSGNCLWLVVMVSRMTATTTVGNFAGYTFFYSLLLSFCHWVHFKIEWNFARIPVNCEVELLEPCTAPARNPMLDINSNSVPSNSS